MTLVCDNVRQLQAPLEVPAYIKQSKSADARMHAVWLGAKRTMGRILCPCREERCVAGRPAPARMPRGCGSARVDGVALVVMG